MLKNYWKIAIRNLVKSRLHSSINIIGLALGMAAATLLLLNIQHGLSIDQFHTKKTQLFKAYIKQPINGDIGCSDGTSTLLGPALKAYPEVKNISRVWWDNELFRYTDKKISAFGG